MLNHRFVVPLILVVFGTALLITTAMAGESKITKNELPGAVLKAFEKAYPKATIEGLAKEEEDGKIYYEIESLDGRTKRDVLYLAEGTIVEIEEVIAANELPVAVMTTVAREFPEGTILKAEKITHNAVVEYGLNIVSGKETHEIVVDTHGKIVTQDETNEDEEKEGEDGDQDLQ